METIKEKFAVIKRFRTAGEANIIKALLDANGIDSELVHADSASLFPDNPSKSLQIDRIAREEDVEKIKEILSAKFDEKEFEQAE